MDKIAFLGTGLMGAALAEAAAKRGEAVSAWNRTRQKAEALGPFGIEIAASPAEAIQGVDRVHVMLTSDAAVDSVLSECGEGLRRTLVVDHSTVSPMGVQARAQRLEGLGIAFLHAPVFMSPAMCRAATGLMLTAGPRAVFERAQQALSRMTGTLEYLGERRDLAAVNKLFGNLMLITITAGLSDVFALGKSLGVPAVEARALFDRFNPALSLTYRGSAMAQGQYAAQFELGMARKDVGLMLEGAGSEPLAVLPAIAKRMDALIERGFGSDDLGVLSIDAVPKAPQGNP